MKTLFPALFVLVAAGAAADPLYPAEFDMRDLLPANGGDGSMGFLSMA